LGTQIVEFDVSAKFKQLWCTFTQEHPEVSFGHLPGLFDLAASMHGVTNRSLLAIDERKRVTALLPLFEVQSRKLRIVPWRMLVSSIEFPGGPLFSPKLPDKLREETLKQLLGHAANVARQCNASEIHIAYPTTIGAEYTIERFRFYPLRSFGFVEENIVC
jgi:hypothetical protein